MDKTIDLERDPFTGVYHAPGDKPRCALVDIDLGKVEARLLAAYLSDPERFHDAMFDTFA